MLLLQPPSTKITYMHGPTWLLDAVESQETMQWEWGCKALFDLRVLSGAFIILGEDRSFAKPLKICKVVHN